MIQQQANPGTPRPARSSFRLLEPPVNLRNLDRTRENARNITDKSKCGNMDKYSYWIPLSLRAGVPRQFEFLFKMYLLSLTPRSLYHYYYHSTLASNFNQLDAGRFSICTLGSISAGTYCVSFIP